MTLIQLQEQLSDGTYLPSEDAKAIVPYVDDGKEVVYTVRRGREDKVCLSLRRTGDDIVTCGSYFVGIDWVEQERLPFKSIQRLTMILKWTMYEC